MASFRSDGTALAPGDHVEQDVPLGAQGHQQDAAVVQAEPDVQEENDGEREDEVRREAGEYLHDRLQVLGDPGIEADPDADRHPDHRRHRHHHGDPQEGQEAQPERVPEDAEALLPGGDVGQHAVQAVAEHGGDDRGEGDVGGAPPGGVADQAAVVDPRWPLPSAG